MFCVVVFNWQKFEILGLVVYLSCNHIIANEDNFWCSLTSYDIVTEGGIVSEAFQPKAMQTETKIFQILNNQIFTNHCICIHPFEDC